MKKTVLLMICALLCLMCYGCKPAPDYYAALQYEWPVIEKPAGWADSKYVFTADKKVEYHGSDGTNTWIIDVVEISNVDSTTVYTTDIYDGQYYSFKYALSENGKMLTITHNWGSDMVIKFRRP